MPSDSTTISTPASEITSALATGSSFGTRASNEKRSKKRRAYTNRQPDACQHRRQPRLKATTSTIPNSSRPSEIAPSSSTSAEGQGISPPLTPSASRRAPRHRRAVRPGRQVGVLTPAVRVGETVRVGVLLVMARARVACRGVCSRLAPKRPAQPLIHHRMPMPTTSRPEMTRQPGIERLRQDVAREPQRDQPQREDAGRVCQCDRQAQKGGVLRRCRARRRGRPDDRLAVARGQGMHRAPEQRQQREEHELRRRGARPSPGWRPGWWPSRCGCAGFDAP